jgi:hypothetical protein
MAFMTLPARTPATAGLTSASAFKHDIRALPASRPGEHGLDPAGRAAELRALLNPAPVAGTAGDAARPADGIADAELVAQGVSALQEGHGA